MKNKARLLTLIAGLLVLASPALAGTGCASGQTAAGCEAICLAGTYGNAHFGEKSIFLSNEDEGGAYLGVTLAPLDEETAADAGMDDRKGALIQSVFDDTPAHEAGLQAGDVVLRFDGESIDGVKQLVELVRAHEPGDEVRVRILRDGDEKHFDVTLAERESNFTFQWKDGEDGHFGFKLDDLQFFGDMASRGRLGVEVRDLDEDLGEYFDVDDGKGALILSVGDETPAAEAGLKPGDVVIELGGRAVNDVSELREAVSEVSGEGEAELVYLRHGKRKSVDVEIEAGEGGPHMMMRGMPHKMWKGHGGDAWHKMMKGEDRVRVHEFFGDGEMEKEKLEKMVEKLEKRLEEIEKKLEDN